MIMPDYYKDFSCIANKCMHSCCKDWEIDIDFGSLKRYENMQGVIGEKLRKSISGGSFVLDEDGRCPFLMNSGLCELICEAGEENLCDICAEHPRFYNEHDGRLEVGVGLCCEAAARLILSKKEKMKLVDEMGECFFCDDDFSLFREYIFQLSTDRNLSISERMRLIEKTFSIKSVNKSPSEWAEFFSELEILDSSWLKMLEKTANGTDSCFNSSFDFQTAYEQLLVYFLYRHLSSNSDTVKAQIAFSLLSVYIIALCTQGEKNIENLFEAARMYSSEIEYCEENTKAIMRLF